MKEQQIITVGSVSTRHPQYIEYLPMWRKVRDCIAGENKVKSKREIYLPRPLGMSGEYAAAYDAYIERAHFPLVTAYALIGALGVIITRLPEFNVPKELEYIIEHASKDGRDIKQLFIDTVIEVFQTGRVPLLVDLLDDINEFRFVQYKAEDLINWKTFDKKLQETSRTLILGVLHETVPSSEDIFSHDVDDLYRVLTINQSGNYNVRLFGEDVEYNEWKRTPSFMGRTLDHIPLYIAGSINNGYDTQPIPLIPVANCSIQIYRKEADLANSEFLSCNPTLVICGASAEDNLPNVVGSSVLITIPDAAASVKYTTTDTAALTHVKAHIDSLYEEAIRHGAAILDNRNGVEAAEALRIRQATQTASVYSAYLSIINAFTLGLKSMCRWAGYDESKVIVDAPSTLAQGVPDSSVIGQIITGFNSDVMPLTVMYKYMIYSGLLDQTVSYKEYLKMLADQKNLKTKQTEEQDSSNLEGDQGNGNEEDNGSEEDGTKNSNKSK